MSEREPTIRSRELGDGLRAAMECAGLTGKDIAERLDWQQPTISRLLHGKVRVSTTDVALFLGACNTPKPERERLLGLCAELTESGWLQRITLPFSERMRILGEHENKAVSHHVFQTIVIPGLLQTEDYLRALVAGGVNLPPDQIDDRVTKSMARQRVFDKPRPAQFVFLLHESVLRLAVGGAEVMSDQLHHLLRLSVRPNISIRVLPASLGVHAGVAGSFDLMKFADFDPVVYTEAETYWMFLEQQQEIVAYHRVFDALAASALDPAQSADLIARLAIELYPAGEDHVEAAIAGD